MNKRNGVFALAAAAALLFAGCGGTGENDDGGSQSSELPVSSGADISETVDTSQSESTDTVIIIDTTVPDTTAAEQTAEITTEPPRTEPSDVSSQIVQTAELLLGIPFADNGISPSTGFDNSGFIYYVLRENGFINCPRLTGEQAAMGTIIGYDELQSGDLAFFCTAESGNPDFGGIYIGSGQMIYCSMPGRMVETADVSMDYWKKAFVSGVRLS